jgi:hypothetical protein
LTSGIGYRRADLQTLAEAKLADSVLLAAHGGFSNAYYLGGYAIEFALKSCISRQFLGETIPDPSLVRKVYDHDFSKLIGVAGLTGALREKQTGDGAFAANWSTVAEWSEAIRYESVDRYSCDLMLQAIRNDPSGVLLWLKQHW